MSGNLMIGTKIDHDLYGIGLIGEQGLTSYEVYFEKGGKITISKSSEEFTVVSTPDTDGAAGSSPTIELDVKELEHMFVSVLEKYAPLPQIVELADKWTGGRLILSPGDETMQKKEIPIEGFFHKIVMVRDRLRVLEQNINSHKQLSDEEKINLQQYITRIYGSLTTFNVLFKQREDYFTGSSGASNE